MLGEWEVVSMYYEIPCVKGSLLLWLRWKSRLRVALTGMLSSFFYSSSPTPNVGFCVEACLRLSPSDCCSVPGNALLCRPQSPATLVSPWWALLCYIHLHDLLPEQISSLPGATLLRFLKRTTWRLELPMRARGFCGMFYSAALATIQRSHSGALLIIAVCNMVLWTTLMKLNPGICIKKKKKIDITFTWHALFAQWFINVGDNKICTGRIVEYSMMTYKPTGGQSES